MSETNGKNGGVTGIARSAIDSMKGNPLALGLLLMNLLYVGVGAWIYSTRVASDDKLVSSLLQHCVAK